MSVIFFFNRRYYFFFHFVTTYRQATVDPKVSLFKLFTASFPIFFWSYGISTLIEYTGFLSSRKIRNFQGENSQLFFELLLVCRRVVFY